ncbi:MAG: outer membrane protein assembly factor [Spirosoma sp.]|nr:outer membrane protein assembly factor [Spirosoma sp.]
MYRLGERRFDRDAAVRELAAKTNEFEQQSQQLVNQPMALKELNRRFARQAKRFRQKAEEGNWVMRNLGEPPAYFSEQDARTNTAKMQRYLTDKGFFNAHTAYRLDTLRNHQIRVYYNIIENAGFYLRNITYEIDDPRVDSLVRTSLAQSSLVVGERYDSQKVAAEKVRIESALRDQGYYAFSRQYIPNPEVDTSRRISERLLTTDSLRRPADLRLAIRNPPGQAAHPIYRIGEVEVRISPGVDSPEATQPTLTATRLDTTRRNGILYLLGGRSMSARLLDGKISLRPGQLYNQTNYRNTQRQLFLLNQFKFVNLNFTDTTQRQLRTLITATPLDKYEATAEGGVTVLYQGQGYPGGFGSLTFRVRNLFGGLETLETTLRYGLEYQTGFATDTTSSRPGAYQAQELGVTSSLIFPQILFPGRIRFRFNPYNPRTQVSLGFTNTLRPDFRRSLLRATMAYNWQTTPTQQFNFLIADINLINANFDTRFGAGFRQQLQNQKEQGGTLYLSFRRSLSSSFSFAYTYNTNITTQNRRANFLRTVVESGGTTLNLFSAEQLRRLFGNATDSTGLQFYKFLRLNIDYRHYIPVQSHTTLAFRINTGVAYGYGPGHAVPYERFFFAGGSNSVRAWLPRRLGPGSAVPFLDVPNHAAVNPSSGQIIYRYEQPGNLLLEGSAELRGRLFHLFADVNGAVFVDAGNVWTLGSNTNRIGSTFQLDTFVPQIAVGTGVGLRLDFSFFLIRLDGGIKVWDPARINFIPRDGSQRDPRFILPEFSLRRLTSGSNPLIINFGIGYPF